MKVYIVRRGERLIGVFIARSVQCLDVPDDAQVRMVHRLTDREMGLLGYRDR